MKRDSRGFTLIELLVVIAIIAILAAVLFPVFATAKEKGRQTRCTANLKQLMQAVRTYCDDNQGKMPYCIQSGNIIPDWAGCYYCGQQDSHVKDGGIWRYTRSRGIYMCPTDAAIRTPTLSCKEFSYSMNSCMGTSSSRTINLDSQSAGRSARILIFIHESRNTINDGLFAWFNPNGPPSDVPSDVHYNGTTAVYADGHAKWSSAKQLIESALRGDWFSNDDVAAGRKQYQ